MDHPFSHALMLAWKTGSLSREGAQGLEHLQERLGMSDIERGEIEEIWLEEEVDFMDRDSDADSVELLEHFSKTLDELRKEKTQRAVRSLGRRFSRHGISRTRLGIALRWLKPFGLDIAFEDGSRHTFCSRQRPQLAFSQLPGADGVQRGRPLALFTGAWQYNRP